MEEYNKLSFERWDGWKNAFNEIVDGKKGEIMEETRKMAKAAAEKIEEIEAQ